MADFEDAQLLVQRRLVGDEEEGRGVGRCVAQRHRGVAGGAAGVGFSQLEVLVLDKGELAMTVNGRPRQKSDIDKLIWSIPELIWDLSRFYHLQPGDLIFTGTPEGVGALQPGDRIDGHVDGVGDIVLHVGPVE